MILGLLSGIAILCAFLFLSHFNDESIVLMLVIFNFIFVSLVFPLNGRLTLKVTLLLIGDTIGFLWNAIFYAFTHTAVHLSEVFNVFYTVLNPLLNLVWIVSFWSISLSFLARSKQRESEVKS